MWKHNHCGGLVVQDESSNDLCLLCNESGLIDGEIYLDHYIINFDGNNNIGDLGGSHV